MIDWQVIGTAIGGLVVGVGSFFAGRSGRKVEAVANAAETDVINMMRQEVARLGKRVEALEAREGRMIRHIYRLEGLMRGNGIEPPPFDLDSDSLRPGEVE